MAPIFYWGIYFAPSVYMDVLVLAIIERYWTTKLTVCNTRCTWILILNYNVNKLASLKLWKLIRDKVMMRINKWNNNELSFTTTLNWELLLKNGTLICMKLWH